MPKLAKVAMREGGTAPAILNAANEAAVALFLSGKICFTDIMSIVAHILDTENVIRRLSRDNRAPQASLRRGYPRLHKTLGD